MSDGRTAIEANGAGAEVDADSAQARRRRRIVVVSIVLTVVGVLAVQLLLTAGSGLQAPAPEGGGEMAGAEGHDSHEVFWRLLLATVVVILVARGIGLLFRRIHQPQVMGEILGGVLLGPSVLGALWPQAAERLFDPSVLPFIDVLAQVGLVLFMFLVGLELDVRLIRGREHVAAGVSIASMVVPFVGGVAVALPLFPVLGSADGDFTPFALFLGASMSITAFPVLARIITERDLAGTRLGVVTITCAAAGDLIAWCLLAVIVAISAATGLASAFTTIGLSAAFIAALVVLGRPLLTRVARHHDDHGSISGTVLALLIVGLLLSALATDRIGIHAIFGAFLFGAIMPHHSGFIDELTTKLEDFAVVFLLPLFFAYSGLRTDVGAIGADPALWGFAALILAVAVVGKWGGSTIAARFVGLGWRESLSLGVLMNCRGLTELVILNIGLDLGVIPPGLFAMFVIMALVTTFMTTPILVALRPDTGADEEGLADSASTDEDDETWRVLVHIPNLDRAYELVHTALSLATSQDRQVEVVLLRTFELPDRLFGSTRAEVETDRSLASLRPLADFVEGAGFEAVPLAVPTRDVGAAVVRAAADRRCDLVLMPWRRPLFGDALASGTVGHVMREAAADVCVLVDPTGQGTTVGKGAEILVPYGEGYHEQAALDLALRLARTHGATVKLLGGDGDDAAHALADTAASAYQRTGVWTTVAAAPDAAAATMERGRDADMVVLGVSDDWSIDNRSLGRVRQVVAERSSRPMLIVRRDGQHAKRGPRRWFRRTRDWMHDTGEVDLREVPDTDEMVRQT